MDLLLQAARVLELGHDQCTDGVFDSGLVGLKSQRGNYFHQAKSKNEKKADLNDSHLYINNGISVSDELSGGERTPKKLGGVATRAVHNQLEKNRRKQLREFFTHLQQCVPSLENKRVATQSILQAAIKYIKNLKKRDVEQEREIQTLARRKSDLKKRFDMEFNKCTEEQQHVANVFFKVINTKIDITSEEQDGETSDSTSTASECPPNDEELSEAEMDTPQQILKTAAHSGICDSRKRKSTQKSGLTQGSAIEPTPSSSRAGINARSLVSSSSVALKQMLEQKKKNQTATEQASPVPQSQKESYPPRGSGSLTNSYPMITTHLASMGRPSGTSHGVTQPSQPQMSTFVDNKAVLNASTNATQAAPPPQTVTATILTKKNKKGTHVRSNSETSLPTTHNSTSQLQVISPTRALHLSSDSAITLTQNDTLYPNAIKLIQQPTAAIKTNDARPRDAPFTAPQKIITSTISNIAMPSFNYLGQAVLANHPGAIALDTSSSVKRIVDTSISSQKILPNVIPFSLAPLVRSLPVTTGISSSQIVTVGSPLALGSSSNAHPTTSATEMPVSSMLTSKIQPPQTTSYLVASSPAAMQPTTLELPTSAARFTALLSAPPSHISCNSTIIKPVSPLSSMPPPVCGPPITIPVTITQSLIPVSLTNNLLSTKTPSPLATSSPLRIFTQLPQNQVLSTSLTNGQSSLMPTVVQLEPSGKVAVVHNLIPGRQFHVQNPHHILAQPFVVMATAGSDFGTPSNMVKASSSNIS